MKPRPLGDRAFSRGIILESWRIAETVLERTDAVRISDWHLDQDFFDLGNSVALVIAQGSSIAVDALERLVASGADEVVRVGTCGALRGGPKLGEAVLARAAVRLEGTSEHYLPLTYPAISSAHLDGWIRSRLAAVGTRCFEGLVATTDGRWRESRELLHTLSSNGVIAIDMETSALLIAGMSRGVNTSSVMFCADSDLSHHDAGVDVRIDDETAVGVDRDGWYRICVQIADLVEELVDAWQEHAG